MTASSTESASALIAARIAALGERRGHMQARVRALIQLADPEVCPGW